MELGQRPELRQKFTLSPQVYQLKNLEETHAAITEAVDDLQRELAETMKRRIEAMGQ